MHIRAGLGQHIRGPVPAVGALQHHFWALAPRGDLPGQLERIVVDANRRTKTLTIRRHPHDHATPPVQIYPDILPAVILVHRGLLRRGGREQPKHYARGTVTRSGGPAPSSHQRPGSEWRPGLHDRLTVV